MYLKRLESHGFKSFANKTVLDFGPGVTCVVGPNGTGKTNVADSLRWVLGEHASRQIRARKTEDVIFAGSDKRPPMGVAEVAITLDNSGQWLPLDFSEVVVSRRAYRNGENEYFINHAKVRLRDVVELFQRAQVGQNSYAFMGQGMVEQALSLRPEDRRALIEEAADVRIYRTRLEDARNKLKQTRENVERAHLLVREIEPRITQLERQAGRAVRYRELTLELAETLHIFFQQQWRDVNDGLLAAYTAEDQRKEDFDRAKAAARACEDALAQLRAAIDERRAEIDARQDRLRSMQDYVRDLERRVALDSERRRMLLERIEELAAEIEALQAERDAVVEVTLLPDTAEQEQQLAAARAELAERRARLTSVEQELLTHRASAIAAERSADRARALAAEASRRATEGVDDIARLRRERENAGEQRHKLITDLASWAREFARLAAEDLAVSASMRQASIDRDLGQRGLAQSQQARDAAERELRDLQAELSIARLRLEHLERVDVQPQAPDAGVRLILEAGGVIKRETAPDDLHLSGVRGLFGFLLRDWPSHLEPAIEAALGENYWAVIFDREDDLNEAVRLLLDGDRGRATMYALDNIVESRPLNLIKEKGIVGVASALVKCDSRYRKLVDTLLGRTVVVENLAVAQRFIKRGIAQAVATLDGVLLRPIGSVSAGTIAVVQAGLAFSRENADLPADVERLESKLPQLETAFERADALFRDDQRRTIDADERLEALRQRLISAQSALASSRVQLLPFHTRFHALAADGRVRDAELDRLTELRARLESEVDQHTRDALEAESSNELSRRAVTDLESVRDQLNTQIAELAAAVAHLDGVLRAGRVLTGTDPRSQERLAQQIESKNTQRARYDAEAATITARLRNDERELAERTAEADGLRAELEPARQELSQFESRERSLANELMDANGRMRESERAHLDAQQYVHVLSEELQTLRVSLESEGFVTTPDGAVERAPDPERDPELQPAAVVDDPEAPPTWLRSEETGLPPIAGAAPVDASNVRDRIADLRAQIRALGPVNEQAASDYGENKERYDFLTTQLRDLKETETQLLEAVDELEREIRERFRATFKVVNKEFERYFTAFFRGGTAQLELGETDDDGLPGVEILAHPPGKKLGSLALLSGGEKSLTAVALLFALLSANPSPICVLDEVDAALDEANVGRFVDELRALSERTQFILITHNRRTIENADAIYGVSMGADSVSRVLSLKLSDVKHVD